MDEVRETLTENMPWSPNDFVRTISLAGDKTLFVRERTRDLSAQDDLRIICTAGKGLDIAVFAERLPWDSKFFGYDVAALYGILPLNSPYHRPHADWTDVLDIFIQRAVKARIKYLFAVVDPRDLATLRSLGSVGFALIETRSFYHMDITQYEHAERYAVRAATSDDISSLGRTAQRMTNPYDRFHSDPFISSEAADRLMYQWIEASISGSFADITIVPDHAEPTAFCTVKYHRDKWSAWNLELSQPVFSAVSPECKGWYKKIISEICYHLKDLGARHSYLSTQVTNSRVIGVWESLGYRFGKSANVLRIVL